MGKQSSLMVNSPLEMLAKFLAVFAVFCNAVAHTPALMKLFSGCPQLVKVIDIFSIYFIPIFLCSLFYLAYLYFKQHQKLLFPALILITLLSIAVYYVSAYVFSAFS